MDGSGDPAQVTSITVTSRRTATATAWSKPTPDVLILEQIQPLTGAYQLGLPAQVGTVRGGCAAASLLIRTAVKPVSCHSC